MKLALTGGVAEGKSTVATYVREAGFSVVSADDIAREVFLDAEVQTRLAALSALELPIDAADLRERIFGSPLLRREVNRVMHPLILEKIEASGADVVEAPLLFESCIHPLFQRIWVVTCGSAEQLSRLTQRLENEAQARAIINAQLPTTVKCAFADRIIRTNLPMDSVRSYVFESIGCDLRAHIALN